MRINKLFLEALLFLCCLATLNLAIPIGNNNGLDLCSDNDNVYVYDYETTTGLSLNTNAKSIFELKTMVTLKRVKDCQFSMELSKTSLTSDGGLDENLKDLLSLNTVFTINSNEVMFSRNDASWSRNIKRAIMNSILNKPSSANSVVYQGVEVNVEQNLAFVEKLTSSMNINVPTNFEIKSMEFESSEESEITNVSTVNAYLNSLCAKSSEQQLSSNFRNLVNFVKIQKQEALLGLFEENYKKCDIAGLTVAQAILFADTKDSFEVSLTLIDNNVFSKLNDEYPIMTALAQSQNVDKNLLNRFYSYMSDKSTSPYYNKLSLIFSTLVNTFCNQNECSNDDMTKWSSIFAQMSDCAQLNLIKSIGNIAPKDSQVLVEKLLSCALNKENSMQIRVTSIESLRKFPSSSFASSIEKLIKNDEEDNELRVEAFILVVKSNPSQLVDSLDADFINKESNVQLLNFMVDYCKEQRINDLLEKLAATNEKLKERSESDMLSFFNRRDTYTIKVDEADLETETTFIYSNESILIPRNIKLNMKLNMFEQSYDFAQITVRLEGLDDNLREIVLNGMRQLNLLKSMNEKPNNMFEMFQLLAQKIKLSEKSPFVSVSLRSYNSDIFYTEITSVDSLMNIYSSLLSIKQQLVNFVLTKSQMKQPLSNGFMFNSKMDVSASIVTVPQHLISSISMSKSFEIQLTSNSKLSFKKEASLFSRINLDIGLNAEQGLVGLSLNLLPSKQIELLNIDSKIYKFNENKQYVELTLSVSSDMEQKCTSAKFNQALGFDMCLNQMTLINDEESVLSMIMMNLDGPFHFDILMKNGDLLNGLMLQLGNENGVMKGYLKTLENNGDKKERLDLTLEKNSIVSNEQYEKNFNVELKMLATNEAFFKLAGAFVHKNMELLDLTFRFENKILYQFDSSLKVKKQTTSSNRFISSAYVLEGLFDDSSRHYKLSMNVDPQGSSIKSYLIIEKSDDSTNNELVQIVNGVFNLLNKNSPNDFDVDIVLESNGFGKVKVTGNLLATLFKSNINLVADYSFKTISLPNAASFLIGHSYDMSNRDKSFVVFQVKSPFTKIDHGVKVVFQFADDLSNTLKNFEIFINTPNTNDSPYNIYYENNKGIYESEDEYQEYSAGLKNFNIDLSKTMSQSDLAKYLIEADETPMLNSLDFQMKKVLNSKDSSMGIDMQVRKNQKNVASANGRVYGSVFSNNQAGAKISMKLLKSSSSMETRIVKRDAGKGLSASYSFETDNPILAKYFTSISIDFNTKIEGVINDVEWNVVYSRNKDESTKRVANLKFITDCFTGPCFIYKIVYNTDSEILGKNFRHLNFDYVNKVNNDMNEMIFDVDYKLLNDGDNVRNATLVIKTDCFTGECKLYKLYYNTNDEKFLSYNWRHLDVVYTMNNLNNVNELKMTVDYRRGNEVANRKADFSLVTDCSTGKCKKYVLKYKTDSEILGMFVREWNVEYLIVNENQLNKMIINVDHRFAFYDETETSRTNIVVETDCSTIGQCNVYKLIYNTNSKVFSKNFKYLLWDYVATHVDNMSVIKNIVDYKRGNQDNIRKTSILITTDCITGKCLTYQIDASSDSELLWYKYFKLNHTRATVNDLNTIQTTLLYRLTSEDVDRKYEVIQVNDISNEFYKIYKFKFETDSPFLGKYVRFMDCDYVSKLEGKVNTFTWVNDYRLGSQEQTRKFFLQITTDCINGDCLLYKIKQRTDSEIGGYVFRSVDLDYQHKFADDINNIDVDIKYIPGFGISNITDQIDYSVHLKTDCFTGSCYMYKINMKNTNPRLVFYFREFTYDYSGKIVDGIYVLDNNVNYRRANETTYKSANLLVKHDCSSGRCKMTKIIWKTDSPILAYNFKYLDADFLNVVENRVDKIDLKINYDTGCGQGLRNYEISVNTDCLVGDCKKYVIDYQTNSETLGRFMRKVNVQWYWKVENDIYIAWYNFTYRRPTDEVDRKGYLLFETDCQTTKGLCNYYKCHYDTDSELLGQNYRYFWMDYRATSENNFNLIKWDWDYRRSSQENVRKSRLNIRTDCFTGACMIYQLNYTSDSETLGYNFKKLIVDHWRTADNGFSEVYYKIDMIRGREMVEKNAFLNIKHDCVTGGACNIYKLKWYTTSEFLSRFYKTLNHDYVATITNEGMTEIKWTWDYTKLNDAFPKKADLYIRTDCIGMTGMCFNYKLKYSSDDVLYGTNFRFVDVDFVNTQGEFNEIKVKFDFITGAEMNDNMKHQADLLFRTDCRSGLCRMYKLKYETNSPYLGRNFRLLDIDYLLTVEKDSHIINMNIDMDFAGRGLTKTNLLVNTNCYLGDCSVYKLNYRSNHPILSYNFQEYNIDFWTKRQFNGVNEIFYTQNFINQWHPVQKYWTIRMKHDCFIGKCNTVEIDYSSNQYLNVDHLVNIDIKRSDKTLNFDIEYNKNFVKESKNKKAGFKVTMDDKGSVSGLEMVGDARIEAFGKDFKISKIVVNTVDLDKNLQELTMDMDFNDGKPRNANLRMKTDCPKGLCHVYEFVYQTESDFLGQNFKYLNIDYNYKAVDSIMNQVDLVITYRMKNDLYPFNYSVSVLTDCFSLNGPCKIYKQKYSTDSPILGFYKRCDIDWDTSVNNDIDLLTVTLGLQSHTDKELRTASFMMKTDCLVGKCHAYKLRYQTNCNVLGYNFKLLDFEYNEFVNKAGLFTWNYKIIHEIGGDLSQKYYTVEVNHDCIYGPCNNYKLLLDTNSDRLMFKKYLKFLNFDYFNKVENNMNHFHTLIDYKLGSSDQIRNTSFRCWTDCISGRCKVYKHTFKADSLSFASVNNGDLLREFNVDYVNKVENGIDEHKLKMQLDVWNTGLRNYDAQIYTDCIVGACDIYKLTLNTDSQYLGPLFSYLKLVYDSKLNGKMNDYLMTIDYTFTLDSKDNKRSCVLTMNTDCMAGSCNIYKMTYKTDSEILNYFIDFFNMDYVATIDKNNMLDVLLLTEYQLRNENYIRSSKLVLHHDCITGDCLVYQLEYTSNDNEYLGRNFNLLKIDYKSSLGSADANKINRITMNVDYKMSFMPVKKNYNFIFETDCVYGKCRLYKIKVVTDSDHLGKFKLLDFAYTYDLKQGTIGEMKINCDYQLRTDETVQNTKLYVLSDCYNGGCKDYTLQYNSNSKILSKNFKVLNFDYHQKLGDKRVNWYIYKVEYMKQNDMVLKTGSLEVSSDCMTGKCDFYDLLFKANAGVMATNFKHLHILYSNERKDNEVNDVDIKIEYLLSRELDMKNTSWTLVTDCLTGGCKDFDMRFTTQSEFLGRNFRLLNIDYHQKMANGINEWSSNIDYIRARETGQRNAKIVVQSDCIWGSCTIYKLDYKTDSEILGKNFKLLSILYKQKFEKKIESCEFNVDYIRATEDKKRNYNVVYSSNCFEGDCHHYVVKQKSDCPWLGYIVKYFNLEYYQSYVALSKTDTYGYTLEFTPGGLEDRVKKANIRVETDCLSGRCKYYKIHFDADNNVFAKNFKQLDILYDFNQVNEMNFKVNYILPFSTEVRNAALHIDSDCFLGPCHHYVLDWKTNSEVLGRNFRALSFFWDSKYTNGLSEFICRVDYKTPSDDTKKTTNMVWSSNCYSGDCTTYKLKYNTDSEVLGSRFSLLDVDFSRTLDNKSSEINLNLDYRRPEDQAVKKSNISIKSNCSTGKCAIFELHVKNNDLSISI